MKRKFVAACRVAPWALLWIVAGGCTGDPAVRAPLEPAALTGCLTDELCRTSQDCVEKGLCSADNCACAAAKDSDCKGSRVCQWFGRCYAATGWCVAAKDEDCRASDGCAWDGACTLGPDALCVATSSVDCQASSQCQVDGACTLAGDRCMAGKGSDCAQAEICKRYGKCKPDSGYCR